MSRRRTILAVNIQNPVDLDQFDDNEKPVSSETLNASSRITSRRSLRAPLNENDRPRSAVVAQVPAAPQTPAAPPPTNEQLSHLYNNCIKMLNENKINAKNAFQLKLIDYLSDIVLNKEITGRDTNFQVVGCTIDAGSKIYAARVDALHQNTYQMLSGLGHNQDENGDNGNMNGNDGTDADGDTAGDDDAKRKEAKKKRRAKKGTQIVENLDQITTKLNEDFVLDDDLYFSRISTSIEQEAIEGLLLNKLKYKNDSLNLLINKDDVYFEIDEIEQVRGGNHTLQSINIKPLCEYAAKCDLLNSKICEEMSKFRFIGSNLDANDDITRLCENFSEDLEKDRFDKGSNMIESHLQQQQQLQQQIEFGNSSQIGGNIDIDNDDMDIELGMDNSGNAGVNSSVSINEMPPNLAQFDDIRSHKSIADMTTLLQHSMNIQSEYSYFNFDKLKLHDLPRHLKAFALKLSTGNEDEQKQGQDQQQKGDQLKDRRKKEAPKLDISVNVDRSKFLKVTKKAIFLSDRTIENRFDKTYNLETERELDFNARQLLQPYWKQINAKLFSADAIEDIDNLLIDNNRGNQTLTGNQTIIEGGNHDGGDHHENDDYDNGNGGFDIPGTIPPTQDFFTQGGGEFETQMPRNDENMILDGDNLVQAPEQVNALYIEYAKKAKNIDAKKLKQTIWDLICMHSSESDKENVNTSESEVNKSKTMRVNCRLGEIYRQLKPPIVSQRTFDDLSVSIVFQMLLFLANEHGLRLLQNEDGSDLRIVNAMEE